MINNFSSNNFYNKINLYQNKDMKYNNLYESSKINNNLINNKIPFQKLYIHRTQNHHSFDNKNNKTFDYNSINKQISEKKLASYNSANNVFKINNSNLLNNTNPNYYQNQFKERLLQNLKNNFSQEKIKRKKMFYVNVNVNLNQNLSMLNNSINNNNNNNSNYLNNNNNIYENENNKKI